MKFFVERLTLLLIILNGFIFQLVFLTVVLLKAYAIGIVWRCYKYLTFMQQHNIRSMLPYIIPEISARQVDYNYILTLIYVYFC